MGLAPRRTTAIAVGFLLVLAGCGAAAPTITLATARVAITHDYSTLFNFANKSVSVKTAVIQDGSKLTEAITEALSSSLATTATGARVDSVQLLSSTACAAAAQVSPCAQVAYDILGPSGVPLFSTPSQGYAVYVSGHWLVAKSTICGLLELFYSTSGRTGTPPGC